MNKRKNWYDDIGIILGIGTSILFFGITLLVMFYFASNPSDDAFPLAIGISVWGGLIDLLGIFKAIFCYLTNAD